MTPEERQERIKDLFGTALELDPSQRDSFLAEACNDEEIRGEVRSLLSEHERAGSFMQEPLLGLAHAPQTPTSPPAAISAVTLRKLSERYEILAEVGRGGMGVVYRARDRETNELVALKILKPEIASETRVVERFKEELRLARRVTHKNVCRTYELLRFDDTVVIAMEYIDGEDLRSVLNRSSGVRLRRGLEWAAQICEALAEAHAQGVVHRDLKPENILIDSSGQIKVMDFGIARSLQTGGMGTGSILGTPAYMAPEQAEGKVVDHRADIYALGLILYEMFAGKAAFHGDTTAALAFKHVHETPVPPREVEPMLPDHIDKAVLKCLAKDPARRFQSVRELEVALTEDHVPPTRPGPRYRTFVWSLILLAGMAVLSFFLGKWVGKTAQPSYHRVTFRRGMITSARFYPDGQTIVYSAVSGDEPAARLFATRSESPESRVVDVGKYNGAHVLSISHTGQMLLVDEDSTLVEMPFNGGGPRELRREVEWADWAPDGGKYALVYDDNGTDRLEFPAGKKLYETMGEISDMRVSPNGSLIAFLEHPIQDDDRGSVTVVDLSGNKKTLSGEYLNAHGLAWSPGGKEVYFTAARKGRARALYAVTLSGNERLVLETPGTLRLHDISGGGSLLLELANERGLIEGLLGSDTKRRNLSWLDYSSAADISPDGKELLFDEEGDGGGGKHRVYLRLTDGSPAICLGDGIAAGLSPDGKWALSILDTPPRRLVLLPTSAGEPRDLPGGSIETFYDARWFPDGKLILLTGSEPAHRLRCYVQDLAGGTPVAKTPEGTYGCLLSPDAKLILAEGPRTRVALYPVAGGEPAVVLKLDRQIEPIRFSTDGRFFYAFKETASLVKVSRIEIATGREEPWRDIGLPDPIVDTVETVLLTPDGKSYVCSYRRAVSDLYVVKGLK